MAKSKAAKKAAAAKIASQEIVLGKIKTVSCISMWEVGNFPTSCSQANVGDLVESPKFITLIGNKDINWQLILYPRGRTQESKDFLSLYLYTQCERKIRASFHLKVLNSKAEIVLNHSIVNSTFGSKASWGNDKFVSLDFILNPENDMLFDGTLTIACELTTLPKYQIKELEPNKEIKKQNAVVESRLKVFNIYKDLFSDSTFSDAALVSESKTIKVHKCILSKSSAVFAAMFNTEMKDEKEIVIQVNDVRYSILTEIIRFVYTGKVNDLKRVAEELSIAAKKYELHGLTIMCEKTMIKSLNIGNVIDRLLFAEANNFQKLKIMSIKFIVFNGSNVIKQQKFKLLPTEIILEICSSLAKKFEK